MQNFLLASSLAGLNHGRCKFGYRAKKAHGRHQEQKSFSVRPALGVTSQAIYDAKKRGKIPEKWIAIAVTKYGMHAESLKAEDDSGAESSAAVNPPETKQDYLLKILENLSVELAIEREERRAMSEENRQLHRDKAELLREIGDLRAKVARLEECKNRLAVANGVPSENSNVA